MENKQDIKISKRSLKIWITSIVIVIILAVILTLLFVKYLPEQAKQQEVTAYKKALFSSVACQYNCPLTMQDYQNKTQLLPDQTCVKSCTDNFRSMANATIDQKDAEKDNLLKDMQQVITDCKNLAVIATTPATVNTTQFFSCVSKDLAPLKSKYNYLN